MQDRNSEQAKKAKAQIEDVFGPRSPDQASDGKGQPPGDQHPRDGNPRSGEAEAAPLRKGSGSSLSDLREATRASNDRIAEAKRKQAAPPSPSPDLPHIDSGDEHDQHDSERRGRGDSRRA